MNLNRFYPVLRFFKYCINTHAVRPEHGQVELGEKKTPSVRPSRAAAGGSDTITVPKIMKLVWRLCLGKLETLLI